MTVNKIKERLLRQRKTFKTKTVVNEADDSEGNILESYPGQCLLIPPSPSTVSDFFVT